MKNSSRVVPTKKSLKVAVVTSRYRTFSIWLSTQKNTESEEFVWVHDLTSARGHWFNRVEKLHDYYEIRDANKVFEYLEKHNLKSHL